MDEHEQTTSPTEDFDAIYAAALPKDAPGAWIREAIDRARREERTG